MAVSTVAGSLKFPNGVFDIVEGIEMVFDDSEMLLQEISFSS